MKWLVVLLVVLLVVGAAVTLQGLRRNRFSLFCSAAFEVFTLIFF